MDERKLPCMICHLHEDRAMNVDWMISKGCLYAKDDFSPCRHMERIPDHPFWISEEELREEHKIISVFKNIARGDMAVVRAADLGHFKEGRILSEMDRESNQISVMRRHLILVSLWPQWKQELFKEIYDSLTPDDCQSS